MATASKGIARNLIERYRQALADNPELARRAPKAQASWLGGDRCQVRCDGAEIRLNGEGNLSPMSAVLAALAACDVVTVAVHAALLGIAIEDVAVEVRGEYDSRALLGVAGAPGAGFDSLSAAVRLTAPGIGPEDLHRLEQAVARTSQVGASLALAVPVTHSFTEER